MAAYSLDRRHAVWRQLHDEGRVLALHDEGREDLADEDGHDDADGIEGDHHPRAVLQGEERARDHDVDGQACRAGHEGQYHHRDEARAATLYGAGGHDGRHIAAEAHDEGYERLAVQPHLVHQLVHDKGCPRHVAGVFHQRDEEIEYEYLGQEDDDGAHATDDAVDDQRAQRSLGHQGEQSVAQPGDSRLYPVHGVLPQGERGLEHDEQDEEEEREAQVLVGQQTVYLVRTLIGVGLVALQELSLLQRPVDETILCIHDGCLGVGLGLFKQSLRGVFASLEHGIVGGSVGLPFYQALYILVAFHQLDGQVARAQVGVYGR